MSRVMRPGSHRVASTARRERQRLCLCLRGPRPALAAVGSRSMSAYPKWSDREYAAPPGELVALPPVGAGIPYRTALEVAGSTSESPDWLVRGYLALGAITEVDGKIKSSGKTTLVTHLVASVLDGQPFLGQPTMTTNVVYLTEQTPGPFREALARSNLLMR